jgi:flagellar protein FliO/FliZ
MKAIFLCALLLPTSALAANTASTVAPLSLGNVFSMLFGLAIVLGLLFGGAWLVKRLQNVRGQLPDQQLIKVLSVQQLGLKDRVMLLQVGEERVLVGSSTNGLRTLHSWKQSGSFQSAMQQSAGQ